jgi:N-acetylmuramoyl-L-alanine amidase
VLRLEVGGAVSGVSVSGTVLNLALPANANRKAALTVAEHEVSTMTMQSGGLAVRFDQPFRYQVVEQSATRTVLELRPVISSVELQSTGERDIYRFHVTGAMDPTVHREGDAVVMNLPGARLDAGVTVPPSLTLQASDTGLVARVTSSRNFVIKRGADYFDLQLTAPGLAGKTIVVDPGHGGSETGAVGPAGTQEKADNLAIALKLKTLLEGAGARVVMTRTSDTRCADPADLAKLVGDDQLHYDLACRSQVANTVGADMFISIHNNANPDASLGGTETYYSLGNMNSARSQDLANFVQAGMLSSLGLQDLKVKHDVFYVTKFTDAPAVLAEVAFISNPTEEQLLGQDAFRQKAAQSIFTGIQRFFQ